MPEPDKALSESSLRARGEFFRHSGWMMIAGIIGGTFAWGVHFLAKRMSPAEYGLFGALMALTMCVPAMPLQMAFTHQTASAVAGGRERQLAGLIRVFCGGALAIWVIVVLAMVAFRREIFFRWEVANPTAFWVMLPFLLITMWMPVLSGMLQGRQNFLWLGWTALISSGTRVLIAAIAVLGFGAGAAGMMTGVLIGSLAGLVLTLWQTCDLWSGSSEPSNWRQVLRETVPLLVGFGAFQLFFSVDTLFAKAYFGAEEVGYYTSAGILSRALMWVVGPLAQVMFPRIVHSHAKSEKTDIVPLVFAGTAILAIVGAVGLSVVGPWVIHFVYGSQFATAAKLLPWYAAAMVPLTLANVLLSNLLARGSYRLLPFLVALAPAYLLGITQFHASMIQLLQVFGVANTLLLATCAYVNWREHKARKDEVS